MLQQWHKCPQAVPECPGVTKGSSLVLPLHLHLAHHGDGFWQCLILGKWGCAHSQAQGWRSLWSLSVPWTVVDTSLLGVLWVDGNLAGGV